MDVDKFLLSSNKISLFFSLLLFAFAVMREIGKNTSSHMSRSDIGWILILFLMCGLCGAFLGL